MEGLEYARKYIDDVLVLSQGILSEHPTDVETVLIRLQKTILKVNIGKSNFVCA